MNSWYHHTPNPTQNLILPIFPISVSGNLSFQLFRSKTLEPSFTLLPTFHPSENPLGAILNVQNPTTSYPSITAPWAQPLSNLICTLLSVSSPGVQLPCLHPEGLVPMCPAAWSQNTNYLRSDHSSAPNPLMAPSYSIQSQALQNDQLLTPSQLSDLIPHGVPSLLPPDTWNPWRFLKHTTVWPQGQRHVSCILHMLKCHLSPTSMWWPPNNCPDLWLHPPLLISIPSLTADRRYSNKLRGVS